MNNPITVCVHCEEEIKRVGEDLLHCCENCHLIEGETKEMDESELL